MNEEQVENELRDQETQIKPLDEEQNTGNETDNSELESALERERSIRRKRVAQSRRENLRYIEGRVHGGGPKISDDEVTKRLREYRNRGGVKILSPAAEELKRLSLEAEELKRLSLEEDL